MRTNPSVRNNLANLLARFREIQHMLNHGLVEDQQPEMIVTHGTRHRVSKNVENLQLVSTVLTTMYEEATLLHEEVRKMRLIYSEIPA